MKGTMTGMALAAILVGVPSCQGIGASHASENRIVRTTYGHGISLGDRVSPLSLSCRPSGHFVVGDGSQRQFITLMSSNDCSSCEPHIRGLERLASEHKLPNPDVIIAWLPGGEGPRLLEAIRETSRRAVCWDSAGTLWKHYNLTHTPLTLLLDRGEVVYLNDQPLVSDSARAVLLTDLGLAN